MQPVSFGYSSNAFRVNPIGSDNAGKSGGSNAEKFQDRESLRDAYRQVVRNAHLSDQQLLDIARLDASRDDKYKLNTYTAMMVGIPVADTFIRGTFSNAPKLSGKLKTMGKVGAAWAGAFALAGLYRGMVDKVTAVSPVIQKTEEKHPVISSLLRLAGFGAVLVGAQKGISKLATILPKKFPGVTADYNKAATYIADKINNSKLNTKVLSKIKNKAVEIATKHPKLAGGTMSTLALAVPFLAAGTLFKAITDRAEKADKIKDNYQKLAYARELSRMELGKILSGQIKEEFNDAMTQQVDKRDKGSIEVDDPIIDIEA